MSSTLSPRLEHVDDATAERNFNAIEAALGALGIYSFAGNPNGNVTASPGAICRNLSGGAGTAIYTKESGVNTNTGWVAK